MSAPLSLPYSGPGGFAPTADNVPGHVSGMIREAGFRNIAGGPLIYAVFGPVALHRSRKAKRSRL